MSSAVRPAGSSDHSSSVGNWGGERSETVYLDTPANQVSQPRVFEEWKLTGEDPVVVAEWEITRFVWWTEFLSELPDVYRELLEFLDIDKEEYSLELEGFYAYRHKPDPRRRCDVDRIFLPVIRCGRYHPCSSVKHRRRASQRTLDRLEFLEEECRKRHVKFGYL